MRNSEETWFDKLEAECDADPECVTYGLLLEVTEVICRRLPSCTQAHWLATLVSHLPQVTVGEMGMAREFLNTPTDTTLLDIVKYAQAVGLKVELNLIEKENDDQ